MHQTALVRVIVDRGQALIGKGRNMPTNGMNRVIQHLRRVVLLQDGAGLTDGQLLGCYVDHRDETAFARLEMMALGKNGLQGPCEFF